MQYILSNKEYAELINNRQDIIYRETDKSWGYFATIHIDIKKEE